MTDVFLILALVCVSSFVVFSIMIVHELSKRGIKINFILLRLYVIKYICQYRNLTLKETGKVGPLYYPCIVSINLALVLAIIGLALR